MFDKNFLWGVATASYQIEGAYLEDGKELSIWDVFSHTKNKIIDNSNADVTCDCYHRIEEDIMLMKELGINVYRFSISWSRIIHDGVGKVNLKGIDYYNKIINLCLLNNIIPFVTLFHWDLPQCLQEKGGYLNLDFVLWFKYYTKIICQYFGDRVKNFITFNEPENMVYTGLLSGEMAPGLKLEKKDAVKAIHHILLAHGESVKILKTNVENVKVGLAACGWVPIPKEKDDYKCAYEDYFELKLDRFGDGVGIWLDPILLGKYPEGYNEMFKEHIPNYFQNDMEIISQKVDYIFINLYSGYYVHLNNGIKEVSNPIENESMDNKTTYLFPEVMYYSPKFLYERYHLPIIVSESGVDDRTSLNDGKVDTKLASKYIHLYLKELEKAKNEGVDIRGYFYWSFIDNFEWQFGYNPRFGLVYCDYKNNQKRIKKDVFYQYKKIIEKSKN